MILFQVKANFWPGLNDESSPGMEEPDFEEYVEADTGGKVAQDLKEELDHFKKITHRGPDHHRVKDNRHRLRVYPEEGPCAATIIIQPISDGSHPRLASARLGNQILRHDSRPKDIDI